MTGHTPWSQIKHKKIVDGYVFTAVGGDLVDRNGNICQIIGRVESDETLDTGPAFRVRFGDDYEATAYSSELNPYYAT
jgi:hypothetical protein